MSHLNFVIFTNFCPIKIDLSGNTVWPQTSVFLKLAKLTIFGIFNELLSTRPHCWMILFLRFSNTVRRYIANKFSWNFTQMKKWITISVIVCIMTQQISSILQEREKMVQPFFLVKPKFAFNPLQSRRLDNIATIMHSGLNYGSFLPTALCTFDL